MEGTTLHGLSLLRNVIFDIKDHEVLVQTMQEHISYSYIPLNAFDGVFGDTNQMDRRRGRPSAKDRLQDARDPLPFRGDNDADAPPLAWTTLWKDTYSNLYGFYTSNGLREWGYVFWDSKRLEKSGFRELLRKWQVDSWETWPDEDDPRDVMWVGD